MTEGAPVDAATTDGDEGDGEAGAKKNPWQTATVIGIRPETVRAKTFRFALPQPTDRLAGQHYVIRLMAPDGYTAQRSYSVANPPDGSNEIDLTIERLEGGEVSMFMHDDVAVGDELEVRGPIGRWFVWEGTAPALLVGGGSGVVPLMAMLRLARKLGRAELLRLVVSVRTPADLYYSDELPGPESTRDLHPVGPSRYREAGGSVERRRSQAVREAGRHRLRMWVERVRGRGQLHPRRPRRPYGAGPRGTVRPHGLVPDRRSKSLLSTRQRGEGPWRQR